MSDGITWVVTMCGATRAVVASDISKTFDWVLKLESFRILSRVFGRNSLFLSNRWLWVVLDRKSSQEFPISADFPERFVFGPILFLFYRNYLYDYFICIPAM